MPSTSSRSYQEFACGPGTEVSGICWEFLSSLTFANMTTPGRETYTHVVQAYWIANAQSLRDTP